MGQDLVYRAVVEFHWLCCDIFATYVMTM